MKPVLELRLLPEDEVDLEFLKHIIDLVQDFRKSRGKAPFPVEIDGAKPHRPGLIMPDEQEAQKMIAAVQGKARKMANTFKKGETRVQRQIRLRKETMDAMQQVDYDPPRAAEMLGIGTATIYERLRMIGYATPRTQKIRTSRTRKATSVQCEGRTSNPTGPPGAPADPA